MISIPEVYRRWPTHDACVAHLETVRWAIDDTIKWRKTRS